MPVAYGGVIVPIPKREVNKEAVTLDGSKDISNRVTAPSPEVRDRPVRQRTPPAQLNGYNVKLFRVCL